MQVTSNLNNLFTANTNHAFKYRDNSIPIVEELLDEEGMAFLDSLLSGMSEEDKKISKLFLSLGLSNESEGEKLYSERETYKLGSKSIEDKLDSIIAKFNEDKGEKTELINNVLKELKAFYANKNQVSVNVIKDDSVLDEFIEDLYSKETIKSASVLVNADIKSKLDEYAQTLDKELDETEKTQMLNEYKQEVLKEYREILESSTNDMMTLQQKGIIKALLDDNSKEASSLEKLISGKVELGKDTKGKISIDEYQLSSLDEKANNMLNDLLVGKSESEKTNTKMWLDFLLMPENIVNFDDHTSNYNYVDGDSTGKKLYVILEKSKIDPYVSQEFLSVITKLEELYNK